MRGAEIFAEILSRVRCRDIRRDDISEIIRRVPSDIADAQVSTCDELLLTELVFDGALSTLQALLLLHCTRGALSTLQALLLLCSRLLLLCSRLLLCLQPAQLAALLSCMVSEGGAAAGKKEQGAAAAAVRLPAMQEPVNRLRELARKVRRYIIIFFYFYYMS